MQKAIENLNDTVVTAEGWTRGELEAAFDKVSDPSDWRGAIEAWVDLEDLELTRAAVMFFTATALEEVERKEAGNMTVLVRVKAAGYRMGPAGP